MLVAAWSLYGCAEPVRCCSRGIPGCAQRLERRRGAALRRAARVFPLFFGDFSWFSVDLREFSSVLHGFFHVSPRLSAAVLLAARPRWRILGRGLLRCWPRVRVAPVKPLEEQVSVTPFSVVHVYGRSDLASLMRFQAISGRFQVVSGLLGEVPRLRHPSELETA